jgi:hypothetical protein
MLTATILYNSITKNLPASIERVSQEPTVTRQTNNFIANIGNIKTASQLVNNSSLYNYVLQAFGLSDMSNAKALITKVLNGGDGSNSFAASLNDPRYTALAAAFNFQANGAATTSSSSTVQTTVSNFYEQTLETNTGQENQGAQLALYFRRMAPNITNSFSILGDQKLLQVFETAFNLPTSFSLENIDVQAKTVSQLVNINQLQNPTYLQNFLERFTAEYDAQNPQGSGNNSAPTVALLNTNPGISTSLLLSIANLKLGGS